MGLELITGDQLSHSLRTEPARNLKSHTFYVSLSLGGFGDLFCCCCLERERENEWRKETERGKKDKRKGKAPLGFNTA